MVNYSDLVENFEYPDAKKIEWNGQDIFVKQYLSSEDKYGIVYFCLLSLNLESNAFNPLLSEILFDLQVVQEYSNINLEHNDTYLKQYDVLQLNGLIDLVISEIPQDEYEELQRLYQESIQYYITYNQSIANTVRQFINNTPQLEEELNNIDPEIVQKGMEMLEQMSKDKHI